MCGAALCVFADYRNYCSLLRASARDEREAIRLSLAHQADDDAQATKPTPKRSASMMNVDLCESDEDVKNILDTSPDFLPSLLSAYISPEGTMKIEKDDDDDKPVCETPEKASVTSREVTPPRLEMASGLVGSELSAPPSLRAMSDASSPCSKAPSLHEERSSDGHADVIASPVRAPQPQNMSPVSDSANRSLDIDNVATAAKNEPPVFTGAGAEKLEHEDSLRTAATLKRKRRRNKSKSRDRQLLTCVSRS